MTTEIDGPPKQGMDIPLEPASAQPQAEREAVRSMLASRLHNAAQWIDTSPPEREWLLNRDSKGWFPMGKVGMLLGEGGAGKTMALTQLAISIASGEPWLGAAHVPTKGRVLLALAEEDADEAHRRIWTACRLAKLSPEKRRDVASRIDVLALEGVSVALVKPSQGGAPERSAVHEALLAMVNEKGPYRAVILDPMSRWAGHETETDNKAATEFITAIEALTKAAGHPAALLSHHTTKADREAASAKATASRGASALTDGARWVAKMIPEDLDEGVRVVELSAVKSNYGPRGTPIPLAFDENGGLRRATDLETEALERKRDNGNKKKPKGTNGRSVTHTYGAETFK